MQKNWIFALSANLAAAQAEALTQKLQAALAEWKAHGTPVPAKASVRDARFVWVEALGDPSGCSIDWLHHTLADLIAAQGLTILPSAMLYAQGVDGPVAYPLSEISAAVAAGQLTADSIIYDTTIVHQGGDWQKPLSDSWAKRYVRVAV